MTTLLLSLSLTLAAAPAAADVEAPPEAELQLANRPIVTLRAGVSGIPPRSRVTGIQARLREIVASPSIGEVTATPIDEGYLISIGGEGAFRIFAGDVDPLSDDTLESVRDRTVANLRVALAEIQEARSLPRLLRAIAFGLAATGLLLGFLWLLRRFGAWARPRLEAAGAKGVARAGSQELADQALTHLSSLIKGVLVALAWTLAAAAVYLWLVAVLGAFPYTRALGQVLGAQLWDTVRGLGIKVVRGLPGLFVVALIVLGTRWLVRLLQRVFDGIEAGVLSIPGLHPDTIPATRRIASALVWLFSLALAYPFLPGSGSAAFQGVTVFAGLMITIGSGAFVGHVLAGYMIIYSRAFRVGDYVRIGDTEGTIQSIGMFTTKIETLRREVMSIPNSVVFSGSVTNYSLGDPATGIIVQPTVTIGYREPWRQVEALLLQAATATEGVRKEPKPFVRQRELSSFYVEYVLFAFVERPEKRLAVLSALHAAIQDAFNAAQVQIMAPHYEADPERPVMAPKSRWNP